jgi:hypothetical protein
MTSVLALGKPPRGKIAVGSVLPVASYVSADRTLDTLRQGGALFLVAPQPGSRLVLFGVIDRPKRVGDIGMTVLEKGRPLPADAWVGKVNTTPVTDVTPLITVKPTKPRVLTRAEEAALKKLARNRTASTSQARTPAAASTASHWRFERVLNAANPKKLTQEHREQLAVACTFYDGWETRADDLPPSVFDRDVELWRVLDVQRHGFDFWSLFGDSGVLFFEGTREPVGIEMIQGSWGAYPKVGWVKRGLTLDLPHLAWEFAAAFDAARRRPGAPRPERANGQSVRPMKWKTRGVRKDDLEGR